MIEIFDIDEFDQKVSSSYDVFICCSSFEERCFSIAKKVSENKKASRVLVFENTDSEKYIEKNYTVLQNLFSGCSEKVPFYTSDPIKSADSMSEAFCRIWDEASVADVLVDITTFTHEMLLMLLAAMRRTYPKLRIDCCYINASEYAYDEPDQQKKWLSRGIRPDGVRTILGYAGNIVPSKKTHLIVIVGYEHERAVQMIESMEADSISLGYGVSTDAVTDKNKGANEQFAKLVKKMTLYYDDIPDFKVPCNDPYKLRDILINETEKIGSDYNIIIVPMNNKISTIGIALACQKRPDIQLCYAPAIVYNYQYYSKAGRRCYFFPLEE